MIDRLLYAPSILISSLLGFFCSKDGQDSRHGQYLLSLLRRYVQSTSRLTAVGKLISARKGWSFHLDFEVSDYC